MAKKELRKKYKNLRKQFDIGNIENLSVAIANNTLKLPIWEKQFYHVFLSIQEKKEVNTEPLLSILSGKDKHIVLSKSDFETKTMKNYLLTDNTKLELNNYGIPEPVDGIEVENKKIDVVFIPLLVFDKQGNRVGYGQGFYDRFLNDCRNDTVKVGLSFFKAEDKAIETSDEDVKLDFCVTPELIYEF